MNPCFTEQDHGPPRIMDHPVFKCPLPAPKKTDFKPTQCLYFCLICAVFYTFAGSFSPSKTRTLHLCYFHSRERLLMGNCWNSSPHQSLRSLHVCESTLLFHAKQTEKVKNASFSAQVLVETGVNLGRLIIDIQLSVDLQDEFLSLRQFNY